MKTLLDIPIEQRRERALHLIRRQQIEPLDALIAVVWPQPIPISEGAIPAEFCKNGHLRTEKNTYVSPNGKRRACRDCIRETPSYKTRTHRSRNWQKTCASCGAPCDGKATLCRACWLRSPKSKFHIRPAK